MSFLLAVAAVSSAALGVRAECESLASAAQRVGAASLLSAVTSRSPTDTSLTALNEVIHSKSEVSDEDKLTFFAPTDAAFAQEAATLDADGLLNHFVDDVYTAEELFVISEFHEHLESEMARDLNLRHDSAGVLYLTPHGTNHMVQVTQSDIPTCAGMLHLVDAVLVPGKEEAIKEKTADELLVKDLSALTDDLQVMGGRSLLDDDREARRERLRVAKRRVALRNRIAKRKAARSSRGGKRQDARTERRARAARGSSEERQAAAQRRVDRRDAAVRAMTARKAAAEMRKAAGRMRSAGRHSKGKKGGKKGGKKHKKDRKPRGMDNGSHGRYGDSGIKGRYAEHGLLGRYGNTGEHGHYAHNDGLHGRYANTDGLLGRYGNVQHLGRYESAKY